MSANESRKNYDSVTLEVIRIRLENIVEEMGIAMIRSSGSPVITEARDYNTALFDAEGRFFSYSDAVQVHIGSGGVAVGNLIAAIGLNKFRPGDVFISNDPHTAGSSHLPDTTVITPIFRNDLLVGFAQSQAHLVDVGGVSPGGLAPAATDCFSEGLRIPPGVKIFDGGQEVDSVRRLIANNVRVPDLVWNDIRSMVASNTTGSRRLLDAITEFGFEAFREYTALSFTLAEEVLRSRISDLPNGVYQGKEWVEGNGHDNNLYSVQCKMTIADDSVAFDFDGSSPQAEGYINCSYGALVGSVASAIVPVLGWDVPFNDGVMTPFDIKAPEGTVVNPAPPAPVGNGHMTTGIRATRLVVRLLNEACVRSDNPLLAQRVQGEWGDSFTGCISSGLTVDTGDFFVWFNMDGGGTGTGAQLVRDGHDSAGAMTQVGNMLPDVEMNEMLYPALYLWKRLATNSGGAGASRGGMGLDYAWTLWGADAATETLWSPVSALPPWGFAGGYPGGGGGFEFQTGTNVEELFEEGQYPAQSSLRARRVELQDVNAQMVPLMRGDVFRSWIAGGGGIGDPLLRRDEFVAADVRDGYVSAECAKDVYGVIMDGHHADHAATAAQRKELRGKRLKAHGITEEPEDVQQIEDLLAAQLVPNHGEDGQWHCPACAHMLGGSADWRDDALVASYTASDRLNEVGGTARARHGAPEHITLSEFICAGCGTQLAAEVTLDEAAE